MNNKMREIMETSWQNWYGSDDGEIPEVSVCYKEGFDAACEKLIPLIEQSATHVYGSAGADHMIQGFRPSRLPIDDLVDAIHEVID